MWLSTCSTATLEAVRRGLLGVVQDKGGTGYVMRRLPGGILAAGKTGMPIVASVYGEWVADYFLDAATYPVPYSLGSGLSYLFPELVQTFHDAVLEPAFMASFNGLDAISASAPSAASLPAARATP